MKFKLKDILDKYIRGPFGSALKRGEMKSEGIPVYEQQNAIYNHRDFRFFIDNDKFNELKRFQVMTGDLIISCSGTIGKVSLIKDDDEKGIISQALLILRVNKKILSPEFLYYFFRSDYGYKSLISRSSGSVQINLAKREVIEDIDIFIPDRNIQDKIVKVLENIDKKININNQINNNLYELIKNNYEALISNYDWKEVELGTIANVTSGKRPTIKKEFGEYPVVGANGVMAYTNDFNFNEDLIITGRVGTLGTVKRYTEQIWASDNTLVVQTKYLNYIENYMKTIDYYSLNRGSTQPLLTQGDLKKQRVMFNEESILKFEEENQIFIDKIRNNEKENKSLEQLRDTLLPRLMNGEIDLDSIEI